MAALIIAALAVLVVLLLILVGALVVVAYAERSAADAAEAARDEAIDEARAANRMRRREVQELTVELSTARAELHARRRMDDADTTPAAPTWADRDLNICRQIWAADGPDTPGSTR
ncbi:hypothetical protein [Micromonospora carbonacea]|uniref:hypothetical protein n=1 Tax=Micromonospora carbonacea TaxID=47853 RepID=UPI0033F4D3D4